MPTLLAEVPPGSPGYDSKSDLYHSGNVRNTGDLKFRLQIAAGDKKIHITVISVIFVRISSISRIILHSKHLFL